MSNFDQFGFLICCIRNSHNGRPNFDAVAKELNIVTKAAAQKRYERMLKANDVATAGGKTAERDHACAKQSPSRSKRKCSGTDMSKKSKVVKREEDGDEDTISVDNVAQDKANAVKKEHQNSDSAIDDASLDGEA